MTEQPSLGSTLLTPYGEGAGKGAPKIALSHFSWLVYRSQRVFYLRSKTNSYENWNMEYTDSD